MSASIPIKSVADLKSFANQAHAAGRKERAIYSAQTHFTIKEPPKTLDELRHLSYVGGQSLN